MSVHGGDVLLDSPKSIHSKVHANRRSAGRRVDKHRDPAASAALPRAKRSNARESTKRHDVSGKTTQNLYAHHAGTCRRTRSSASRSSNPPNSSSPEIASIRSSVSRDTPRPRTTNRLSERRDESRRGKRATALYDDSRTTVSTITATPHSTDYEECEEINPGRISTRVVYRNQLVTNFVEIALMNDGVAKYQNPDLAFLPQLDYSNSALLQAAVDTVSFVGLGTAHNDNRLITEARLRYSCALQLLNTELRGRKPDRKSFFSVVTSIMMLRLCSLFDTLSMDGSTDVDQGWHWHLEAIQNYMKACGPKNLLQTELDWNLFRGVRHYMFYYSIFQQAGSMFAEPEWLAMADERASADDGVTLYSLRMHLPGLLIRVKRTSARWSNTRPGDASKQMIDDFDRLYTDLQWLRNALSHWMAAHGELVGDTELLDMRAVPGVRTDPRPFQLNLLRASLVYSSIPKAAQCTTCWMLCTTLDGAMSQLLSARIAAQTSAAQLGAALRTINRDAYVCVTNLARSVDWCSRADVARFSTVGAFHLQFAKNFYLAAGCELEVAWCQVMEGILTARAREFSQGSFPTLCKYLHRTITMSHKAMGVPAK